jgi:hypothetical protein
LAVLWRLNNLQCLLTRCSILKELVQTRMKEPKGSEKVSTFFCSGAYSLTFIFIWALFQFGLLLSLLFHFSHFCFHSQGLLLF